MERSARPGPRDSNAPDSLATGVWTLSDGHAGNLRQANALAQALGIDPVQDKILQSRAPWSWLAPRWMPGARSAFGAALAHAQAPRVAIGCGRQAALATRLLRKRGARAVQILDPRISAAHWDLVIVPEHDRLRGANVVSMLGSLHPVDDLWLARARADFAPIGQLPSPRTAVLVGGPTRHVALDPDSLETLMAQLDSALERDGGSLLLSASRRTPQAWRDALRGRYAATTGVMWLDDADGANPYPGLLAWADRIVCTPDSVNMVSEACATAVPVFVFAPAQAGGRIGRFLETLLQRGRVRAVDDSMAAFEVEPLCETVRVAAEVRQRLHL